MVLGWSQAVLPDSHVLAPGCSVYGRIHARLDILGGVVIQPRLSWFLLSGQEWPLSQRFAAAARVGFVGFAALSARVEGRSM